MRIFTAPILALITLTPLLAQETTATTIPHLVRFPGTFHPASGLPAGPTESATFAVYAEENGGTPLWQETQNVALDAEGHYTAVLGATQNDGLPLDLFTASSPRWLGVMFNRPGETEQRRVQLVSVPYALKASDAETLGGKPASAYLLDPNVGTTGTASSGSAGPTTLQNKSSKPRSISGTINFLPYFTDNTNDLGNSLLYQSGGNIGLGTTTPGAALDIQGSAASWIDYLNIKSNYTGGGAGAAGMTLQNLNASMLMRAYSPGSPGNLANSIGWFALGGSNKLLIGHAGKVTGDDLQFFTNNSWASPQLVLTNGGFVGIGTTSPGSKLDVAGDINFSGILRYLGNPAFTLISNNTAAGSNALVSLSTGDTNTAIGSQALNKDTTGTSNTGIGYFALKVNTGGSENTAVGAQALQSTNGTSGSEGSGNTAIGWGTLENNTTGNSNIAIGLSAGSSITGSNNIDIGNNGVGGDSGVIRIGGSQGSFYAAGIRGVTTGNNDAVNVVIDSNGQLGTVSSSRRYKEDIQDMGDTSSNLMRLRPVTFRYKKPFSDGSKPIQYGLIAEEVAEVYPDLVAHSADGQIETVKYQVLDSMLLNEMQKQQHQIGQQQEHIQQLEEQNRALAERLEKLEAAIEAGSR